MVKPDITYEHKSGGSNLDVIQRNAEHYVAQKTAEFGGGNVGNGGGVHTDDIHWHHRPVSASITLPPLAAVWFRFSG